MLSYYDINLNEVKRFWWNDWVTMSNKVVIGMYAETLTHRVKIDRVKSSDRFIEHCDLFPNCTLKCYKNYNYEDNRLSDIVNNTVVGNYTYCLVECHEEGVHNRI